MKGMKRLIMMIACAMACAAYAGEPADTLAGPHLELLDKEANLGEFYAIHPQTGTIRVRNTGNQPLLLLNVRGDCGCTGVQYPDDPIPPDSTVNITVRFNGKGRVPGEFRKMIRIRSNGGFDTAFVTGTILKSLVR